LTKTQTYHQNQLKPFSYKYKTKQKSCVLEMYLYNCTRMVYEEKNYLKTLDFIASPEGRAIPKAKVNPADIATTGDQMKFEYSLKDHLGNLRVICRCGEPKRDAQGVIIPTGQCGAGIDAVAVVQEQHYDAWGLAFTQATGTIVEDKFKYNGKELVTDLELGWNGYGFRMYDATICRWSAVDPLAEDSDQYQISPYVYCFNNPVNFIDLDGMKGGDPWVRLCFL
jgi:RHS repeat-associated protein